MAEKKILPGGESIVFDRCVSPDASRTSEFAKNFSLDLDPVYLERLFAGFPAFHVQNEDGEMIGFLYSRGARPDMIQIVDLLVDPRYLDAEIAEELLRLFQERARSWKNCFLLVSSADEVVWQERDYRTLWRTEDSILLVKEL